jgi:hypothetical protein
MLFAVLPALGELVLLDRVEEVAGLKVELELRLRMSRW